MNEKEQIKSLASLKRRLTIGSRWRTTFYDAKVVPTRTVERHVAIKQTNGVQFSDNSWMYLERASNFRFTGSPSQFQLFMGFKLVASYEYLGELTNEPSNTI